MNACPALGTGLNINESFPLAGETSQERPRVVARQKQSQRVIPLPLETANDFVVWRVGGQVWAILCVTVLTGDHAGSPLQLPELFQVWEIIRSEGLLVLKFLKSKKKIPYPVENA